jgi:hypothetical protein
MRPEIKMEPGTRPGTGAAGFATGMSSSYSAATGARMSTKKVMNDLPSSPLEYDILFEEVSTKIRYLALSQDIFILVLFIFL